MFVDDANTDATSDSRAAAWPAVSVVIPAHNEASSLADAVETVLDQDYPGEFDVTVAVAPSRDGTEHVAAWLASSHDRVRVVANPRGLTAAGLNQAVATSTGEVVVRVDGHARLSPGYIRRAVELLQETGADNVGGIQEAVGATPFEQAVAAAMTSRFGTGDAKFHYGGKPGPTDTVYLGVFRRDVLVRLGGFDESLIRNQDYELNWRIRDAGGVVYFHPDLRVQYRPRGSLRALSRQYFQYGRWKRVVVRRHPRSFRLRQAVPPLALMTLAASAVLGVLVSPWWWAMPGAYAAAVLVASLTAARGAIRTAGHLMAIFPTMHLAWGAGFLFGRRSTRRPSPPLED